MTEPMSELTEYVFNRYRRGIRMAEGARVRAFSEEDARNKAAKLFYEQGDEFRPWYPERFVLISQASAEGKK